jgi:hypothetical protein
MRCRSAWAAIISLIILSAVSQARELDLLDPHYRWRSPNPAARIILRDRRLTLSSPSSSTGIYNTVPLELSATDLDIMVIRMKTSKDGLGEVSWRPARQGFSPARSFNFYLGSPDRYHDYYLNLRPYLTGQDLDHILFFPFSQAGTAEITVLKFGRASFWQKLLAGWQEFWGPAGRSFTGSSFFILKSPRLFGRPIMFYLNWLIGLALFISLTAKRPRLTIILVLACWLLLEGSSLVNNWIFFQEDLRFCGKSLAEKRIMQNEKDFYQFMEFAAQHLPAGASFDILAARQYPYNRPRAAYYLYPRTREENAPYLLVFDRTPDRNVMNNYRIIARFRPGAYILERDGNN